MAFKWRIDDVFWDMRIEEMGTSVSRELDVWLRLRLRLRIPSEAKLFRKIFFDSNKDFVLSFHSEKKLSKTNE